MKSAYPKRQAERDRWILARRPPRPVLDPWKPSAFILEEERSASGSIEPVATVFLTNRECPWRCLMCDLWKHTLLQTVPPGAIPSQLDYALARLNRRPSGRAPGPTQIKLYNSGSFFDPRAIPPGDHPALANRLQAFRHLIVECHPSLVGERVLRFRDRLQGPRLEVAMGLETAHPNVLPLLNKRMSLAQFERAAQFLRQHDVDVRVFVLVQPPFMAPSEALHWAERSVDVAFEAGANVVSLIPTRPGNGALEVLAAEGHFRPPPLSTLEEAVAYGIRSGRGRVFADLWGLEAIAVCPACSSCRIDRLRRMNRDQHVAPSISCPSCPPGKGRAEDVRGVLPRRSP